MFDEKQEQQGIAAFSTLPKSTTPTLDQMIGLDISNRPAIFFLVIVTLEV